ELVHDNKQLHLAWRLDVLLLDRCLELLRFAGRHVLRLAEIVGEHLPVYRELKERLVLTLGGRLVLDIALLRTIARYDGALAAEFGVLKQLVNLTGRVHAARDEDGIAVPRLEPGFGVHVVEDIRDDSLEPLLRAVEFAKGRP